MVSDSLIDAIVNIQEEIAVETASSRLDADEDPLAVLDDYRTAVEEIGKRFEDGDAFIPELILAGEMLRQITELAKPRMSSQGTIQEKKAKVVFGIVQSDIHDIGKDIVVFMLDINGFDVIDLGVDVPPDAFVDKVREKGSRILGLSGFLTLAFDPMKHTIEALEAVGLREKMHVMIGGRPITEEVRAYTGADAWGSDASAAVRLASDWFNWGE